MAQYAGAPDIGGNSAGDAHTAGAGASATASHGSMWPVCALLAIHAGLLAYGAVVHSPTYNEPAHLAAGLSYWKFARFDVYNVNPPLVRMVAAIPVLLAGCEMDWKFFHIKPGVRPEMALGNSFCEENGYRTAWLVTIARWACIPFSLLGGYVCFRWGDELYGHPAGLLSLTLWCFCPNIVAHGHLITSDVAATALGAAACYRLWRWLKSPTWWNAASGGLVLGVAELTKTILVVFYPLWPLLWLIYRWPNRRRMARSEWMREFGMLSACGVTAIYVINIGYGFEGSFTRLGDFKFISQSFTGITPVDKALCVGNRFSDSWIANVYVPLPKNYLIGIDVQRKDFEAYGYEFYLGGVWSQTGWWYYYLYALAIKVPIGTWLLIPVAVGTRLAIRSSASCRNDVVVLAPAIVILALVSVQSGMNEHMRYVLPIFPFIYVWLGSVARCMCVPKRIQGAAPIASGILFALVVWSTSSSLLCYPHSLSYFNELAGGTSNGWKYLAFSNIDWGQDLLYLKRWHDEHPDLKPLKIALYGAIDPRLLGIDGEVLSPHENEPELTPGYYAVSATIRAGFGQLHELRKMSNENECAGTYETVGGSIIVFVRE